SLVSVLLISAPLRLDETSLKPAYSVPRHTNVEIALYADPSCSKAPLSVILKTLCLTLCHNRGQYSFAIQRS
ncbi:MAG: hypothetical protein VYC55_12070, partial [Pseudomonadota bacterium]|nr:hypothetical protein [Pseudomonadota bacterium]